VKVKLSHIRAIGMKKIEVVLAEFVRNLGVKKQVVGA